MARKKQTMNPLDDGYVLVRPNEREHPGHSEILRERLDALARYLGHGNYEPSSRDARRLKRARRLWAHAYSNYRAMLSDPVWWRVHARNQYPIVFPPDTAPMPASIPDPFYVTDRSVLPYPPFKWGEQL